MVLRAQPAPTAVPVAQRSLPGHWRSVEFISDIHLSATMPRTAQAFFTYLEHTQADAVFLLGDVFEVWVGDDMLDHPGFEADCAERLRGVAARRSIGFMVGNRDFLAGARFQTRCGLTALADPTVLQAWGQAVLLTHGDALCLGDTDYQAFRHQVREAAWQQAFLARPFNERSALARQMRDASERRKTAQDAPYVDIDPAEAHRWLQAAGTSVLIHGHTHQPQSAALPAGGMRHVLSDWDADTTHARGDVLRWTPQGIERVQVVRRSDTTP